MGYCNDSKLIAGDLIQEQIWETMKSMLPHAIPAD